jgi:hypothetical protein
MANVNANDVGTTFTATIIENGAAINISSATIKEFLFVRPDNSQLVVPAAFVTNGADGQLSYATKAGDINQPGGWAMQAKIVMPSGTFYSDVYTFTVGPDLAAG